ncbi:MAG: hypothetical protein JRF53_00575 [Deltaproteobacteria bacterium]|nr:hypothetical protein [Deltaproteobacteria bacterium]
MENTPIERYGRKLAHVVNMYLREVKPEGWHVDKELTQEDGEKLLEKINVQHPTSNIES